jgi:hypothetical protein
MVKWVPKCREEGDRRSQRHVCYTFPLVTRPVRRNEKPTDRAQHDLDTDDTVDLLITVSLSSAVVILMKNSS